jgi:hypothetical protein
MVTPRNAIKTGSIKVSGLAWRVDFRFVKSLTLRPGAGLFTDADHLSTMRKDLGGFNAA